MTLTPSLSAYLDLIRITAALAVLLGHMDQDGLYMSWNHLSRYDHEAVVIFFVLSGFIIASTAPSGPGAATKYVISRSTRIYSVAIPALAFSIVLASGVGIFAPNKVPNLSNYTSFTWSGLASSLLFLNESWIAPARVPLNGPYWSLAYEVWYYILFGLFAYARSELKWFLIALGAFVAGPAIIALAPVWVIGALLARLTTVATRGLTPPLALTLFVGALVLIGWIGASDVDLRIRDTLIAYVPGYWRLGASSRMVTDYLIGLLVALNLISFQGLAPRLYKGLIRLRQPLARAAGFSFSLYLFHRPVTQIWGACFPNTEESIGYSVLAALTIVGFCYVVSTKTEGRVPAIRGFILRNIQNDGRMNSGRPL
jgi:peptidoglycan/LPS O-acetylase OafA/YrhL